MKKLIALVATALVVIAASQLVSTVGATGKATIARRVATLERKAKSLQTQVNRLKANDACETNVIGVNQNGNPAASQGYLYTADGVNVVLTTALDLTHPDQTAGGYVPLVNSSCVSGAKASHYRPTQIGPSTSGQAPFQGRLR